jgi:hypothetical protein
MDAQKIKEIQGLITRHQKAVLPQPPRPAGHNRQDEDLNKVAANDIIGKGGESDLRK